MTTTTDGRPYVAPTATGAGTGKKVGFDNTHGSTAGAADWTIDGAMSDFACGLAGQSYAVEEIRAYPFTATNLGVYDTVIIPEPNIPFTTAEEQALASYVASGKGLLMIADHYQADRNFNTWDGTEVFNGWRRGHYQAAFTSPYYWYNGTATSTTYTWPVWRRVGRPAGPPDGAARHPGRSDGVAFLFALLLQGHWMQLWHIYVLAFGLGTLNALDMPAAGAFIRDCRAWSRCGRQASSTT